MPRIPNAKSAKHPTTARRQIAAKVTDELHERLRLLCEAKRITKSRLLVELLRAHLEKTT